MGTAASEFLERYSETQFRYSAELLPLLSAGRAQPKVSPGIPAPELLSTYERRARHIEPLTSEYWRAVYDATVEICEGLRAEQDRQVRWWTFEFGDTAASFQYCVLEAVDPPRILGCLRFPEVVSFPAERVSSHRVRIRAGAKEFRRRAGSLISTEGRILFSCFTNDGALTLADAALEIEEATDSLWLTLPFKLGGDGDVQVIVRADQAERIRR